MKMEKKQFSALSADKAGIQIEEDAINELEEKVARLQQELSEKETLIVELKEKLAAAEKEAMFDELTGLDKRKHFKFEADKIISSLKTGEKDEKRKEGFEHVSFLFCDIDYFKKINDTYGHDVGDTVLKEIANFLKLNVREDDRVCRWGGDEIIIALLGADEAEAALKAEKIREKIKELNFSEYPELKVSLSIGVAARGKEKSFDEIIKIADEAMYVAKKERGRDNVVLFSEINF